jgi:hypothetical protein
MTENLIDRAWDVFERVQKQHGAPSPDEVSFVGGFTACFGILVGKVDIGLDQNAPLDQHLDLIHRSLTEFASRVTENQAKQDGNLDQFLAKVRSGKRMNGH